MMNLKVPPKIIQMINQEGEGGQRVSADGSLRYVFFSSKKPTKKQQKTRSDSFEQTLNKSPKVFQFFHKFSFNNFFDFVDFSFFVAVE